MNFREAAEIARASPGAVLTRGDNGELIVRLLDGKVVTKVSDHATEVKATPEPSNDELVAQLAKLRDDHANELAELLEKYSKREGELQEEIAQLKQQCSSLSHSVDLAQSKVRETEKLNEALREEKRTLQNRLGKVSAAEWERINEMERIERDQEVARKRAERITLACPCHGEVENCARCYGAGTYVSDGFGNRI